MIKPKDLNAVREDITALLKEELPYADPNSVFQDMLFNLALLRNDNLDTLELRLLNSAFKELRYAMKVFKPYRDIPKAAVFGSARTPSDHAFYKNALDFGQKLSKKGWMVITGGASGIMEAAMVGAGADKSFGLNILLPFEQEANEIIRDDDKLINFKYFFTRKLMFLKESEATVLFPGGFGTMDEGFESFTLVQTGKAKPRPIVFVDSTGSGYWTDLIAFFKKQLQANKLISDHDLDLFYHCQDADKAVEAVTSFYKNYHSSRFVKDGYLIRCKKPLSNKMLEDLTSSYSAMMLGGSIKEASVSDDAEFPELFKIKFPFDKSSYALLHKLIDKINTF